MFIKTTHPLRALICVLALVIGLAAGQTALAEQSVNTQSPANFREDYPLKEYRDNPGDRCGPHSSDRGC